MPLTSSHGTSKRLSLHIILAFCLSFFLLWLSFPKFSLPISPQDEGILLVYPELILKGFVPNRDFATMYPPGNFWLLAFVYSIFEPSVLVERSVGFVYILAIMLGVFFISIRFEIGIALISAVVSCIILKLFPTFGAFSWFGGVAIALWSLIIASKASLAKDERYMTALSFASGILSGAGMLFRIDLVLVTVLSCMTVLGLKRRRNAYAYLLGVSLALTPLIVHTFHATFVSVFENLVLDILRIGSGRKLPLNINNINLLVVCISSILTFIMGLTVYVRNRDNDSRLLFGIGIFSIGLLPQAVQRADPWHLVCVGSITVPIFIVVLYEVFRSIIIYLINNSACINYFEKLRNRKRNLVPLGFALGICAVLLLFEVNVVGRPLWWRLSEYMENAGKRGTYVASNGRVVPLKTDRVADTQSLIDKVHELAKPGDVLFVGPGDLSRTNYSDSFLYFLFPELKPASYFLEMNPGSSNRPGSRLAADIEKADIIILNKRYDSWIEGNDSRKTGGLEPTRILQSQFCLRKAIGTYVLLTRCGPQK